MMSIMDRQISSSANSLIDNWTGQLKHWLSKTGENKNTKGWLTYRQEFVCTFDMNMSGAKRVFPLDRFVCVSGGLGEGV